VEKEENNSEKVGNVISDETGQYDARFILWREFCAINNVAVETLPSELDAEMQEKWEDLKNKKLL
jgi:hypothetical protein